MLRGDEVGALLGDFLLRSGAQGTYAASIVSSSLLGKMAERHGQPYVETLTGFKWIAASTGWPSATRRRSATASPPTRCGTRTASRPRSASSSWPHCSRRRDGRCRTGSTRSPRSTACTPPTSSACGSSDLSIIAEAMSRLRSQPPTELGGLRVEQHEDLTEGSEALPPTDGLRYRLADGARVVVRPSGTEPKIKCYLEVVVPVDGTGQDARGRRPRARSSGRRLGWTPSPRVGPRRRPPVSGRPAVSTSERGETSATLSTARTPSSGPRPTAGGPAARPGGPAGRPGRARRSSSRRRSRSPVPCPDRSRRPSLRASCCGSTDRSRRTCSGGRRPRRSACAGRRPSSTRASGRWVSLAMLRRTSVSAYARTRGLSSDHPGQHADQRGDQSRPAVRGRCARSAQRAR